MSAEKAQEGNGYNQAMSTPSPFPADAFRRYDETPDEDFYQIPRLVTHIDDAAIDAVTQLYRENFPDDAAVLDLMSSWVSHLPSEAHYRRVVGLGMNERELAANPHLDTFVVQNLNENPGLPFADSEFDACALCVSVQYLTQPIVLLREVGRVLSPGGALVLTFSNRCFPTKAVALWQMLDDAGHLGLVIRYLESAGNWENIRALDRTPTTSQNGQGDPLFAVVANRTK